MSVLFKKKVGGHLFCLFICYAYVVVRTRLLFILIQLHQKLSRSRSPDRIMTGLDGIGYYSCMVASGYYSSFMMAISRKSSILHQNFFLVLCFVYKLCCPSKFMYPVGVIIYCNTYAGVTALVWRGGSSSCMQIGRGCTMKG